MYYQRLQKTCLKMTYVLYTSKRCTNKLDVKVNKNHLNENILYLGLSIQQYCLSLIEIQY